MLAPQDHQARAVIKQLVNKPASSDARSLKMLLHLMLKLEARARSSAASPRLWGEVGIRADALIPGEWASFLPTCRAVANGPLTPTLSPQAGRGSIARLG